jgi:hypothetical protein
MTSKKEVALVSGTELSKYLKSLGSVTPEVAKAKADNYFKGRNILEGIWNLAAASANLSKPSRKEAPPIIEENIVVEDNLQSMLAGYLLEEPLMPKAELEERTGNPISKDAFNRAQIIIGGVTKFQKELFEDFVKTAVHLESTGKLYRNNLSVSAVQKYTRRTDGLRYGPQIRNSPYFHRAVANRLKGPEPVKPVAPKSKPGVVNGYERLSSIIIERGYDALITVDSNGNKVIEIVRISK